MFTIVALASAASPELVAWRMVLRFDCRNRGEASRRKSRERAYCFWSLQIGIERRILQEASARALQVPFDWSPSNQHCHRRSCWQKEPSSSPSDRQRQTKTRNIPISSLWLPSRVAFFVERPEPVRANIGCLPPRWPSNRPPRIPSTKEAFCRIPRGSCGVSCESQRRLCPRSGGRRWHRHGGLICRFSRKRIDTTFPGDACTTGSPGADYRRRCYCSFGQSIAP